ncbi:hypothetical protein BGX21_001470 [Mortierella sp. AD011]|nr:hypothetical protein BGX20_010222 [Mortierella sp. AD010]KAF9403629.1 hypothetical protein BGX21_001470 [Mortierella sp. AD011]
MTDSSPHDNSSTSTTFNESFATSPSMDALKALPRPISRPISIPHSQSYQLPPNPTGQSLANELRGARSSVSLNLLSTSNLLYQKRNPQDFGQRVQIPSPRSSPFSNPFKKLQNPFSNTGKKSLDVINNNNDTTNAGSFGFGRSDKSLSSANSLTSWKSKGAEILSKSLGRNRKNSEPLLIGSSANPIFGSDLEDAIRTSHIQNTPLVPAVLYRCAEFLEAKGVDEVGLYRVPGSHAKVQKLKRMFDTGKDYNLMTMDGIDPNDIATLLKLYLRELPSPLMPPALLEQFQSLLTTDRQICHTLRGILVCLPPHNYVVLSFLCHHLSKIASHDDKTKMTVSNLALVFAPTLAIGSVLFKALLGGFFDGTDTPENREKGLRIVWGGLLQDIRDDNQEQPEDEGKKPPQGQGPNSLEPSEEEHDGSDRDKGEEDNSLNQVQDIYQNQLSNQEPSPIPLSHQEDIPTTSPFIDHDAGDGSHSPPVSQEINPLDAESLADVECPSEDRLSSATLSRASLDDADEESRLIKAMLEREEVATKPPLSLHCTSRLTRIVSEQEASTTSTPVPPSHVYSTTTVTGDPNTTSTSDSLNTDVLMILELGLSPPSMSIPTSSQNATALHVTVNSGAETPTLPSTSIDENAKELLPRKSSEGSERERRPPAMSTTEAPQLPPSDPTLTP